MATLELKEEGNRAFSSNNLKLAIEKYSSALDSIKADEWKQEKALGDLYATCLSNRAACRLRIAKASVDVDSKENLNKCIDDCTNALEARPGTTKALYRRAQAKLILQDASSAVQDLSRLIHMEPQNKEAGTLLREAKSIVSKEHAGVSEPLRLIRLLKSSLDENKSSEDIASILRAISSLCTGDSINASDFARNDGIKWTCEIARKRGKEEVDGLPLIGFALSVLSAICDHKKIAEQYVSLDRLNDVTSNTVFDTLTHDKNVSIQALCTLVDPETWGIQASTAALTTVMRILRAQPLSKTELPLPKPPDTTALSSNDCRVEELPAEEEDDLQVKDVIKEEEVIIPFLPEENCCDILKACIRSLQGSSTELFVLASDALVALYGECDDYFTPPAPYDSRMESMEDRCKRFKRQRVIKQRTSRFASLSLNEGVLDALIVALDSSEPLRRARVVPSFGRLLSAIEDEVYNNKQTKSSKDKTPPEEDVLLKSHLRRYILGSVSKTATLPPLKDMKLRAVLTSTLLTVKPSLGIWALQEPGGMQQTLQLIATGDIRCQDIAAEVMCLAAPVDGGQELLGAALQSGAIHELLKSPHGGIRAAAASTITKLSIKAKALEEDTPEVSAILNASIDVIKLYKKSATLVDFDNKNNKQVSNNNINASSLGPKMAGLALTPMTQNLETSLHNASSMSSVERAIETIAAMAGKTHIKEELVNGSYRLQASMKLLSSLDLDARSSAAYGLAHIFALLTVTNAELHKIALAEKDITPEQFAKLQELQRIKGVKDENGNPIEEKVDNIDTDTDKMCRNRIKTIVQAGGFSCLVRLFTFGSEQTKEHTARALRQMCVEESVRGSFIQQGALKACCDAITQNTEKNTTVKTESTLAVTKPNTRREAAHAVAKALITTDPSLLQEHSRLGTIQPLIYLARDVDSGNLQQFEALLALTNILSLGESEIRKFVKEKGVSCAHYLMFSDHTMVRRAACEIFCNCPTDEAVLKLLRDPEKVRLWTGLCEEWTNTDESVEGVYIARACSGTLAISAQDEEVCDALLTESIGVAVESLLQSQNIELIHRALVIVNSLVNCRGNKAAIHLLETNCIPAIGKVHNLMKNSPEILSLAKNTAQLLAAAIKVDVHNSGTTGTRSIEKN
jgi:hypothetical protein